MKWDKEKRERVAALLNRGVWNDTELQELIDILEAGHEALYCLGPHYDLATHAIHNQLRSLSKLRDDRIHDGRWNP